MTPNGLKRYLYNLRGKPIKEKLIVFESDDWGMVRTRSIEAYRQLSKTYPLDHCDYSWRDALERKEDLQGLLEVLSENTNSVGSRPVFTLNTVMFNPDFEAIRRNGYVNYVREPFDHTYDQYDGSRSDTLALLRQGMEAGYFKPQFHATEHVHIGNWMNALRTGDKTTHVAFGYDMPHLFPEIPAPCSAGFLDAWGYQGDHLGIESRSAIISIGLSAFERFFGFKSKTTIAPCYIWSPDTEDEMFRGGVLGFQGGTVQKIPEAAGLRHIRHYMGQQGKKGQRYFVRNCSFELERVEANDYVDRCMKDIEVAFMLRKPALISTHRVNYIGRINEANRDTGLSLLNRLLKAINRRWPKVRYLSTPELLNWYS
jgi:hypothetical protein